MQLIKLQSVYKFTNFERQGMQIAKYITYVDKISIDQPLGNKGESQQKYTPITSYSPKKPKSE